MSNSQSSFLSKLSRTIGLFRGVFLPFGLFAIVAIGIHAGSDRVDDYGFVAYNFVDARLDELFTWLIRVVYRAFDVGPATIASHTFYAIDLVDLEVKDAAARWTALFVELGADLVFAIPIFRHRDDEVRVVELVVRTYRDFTLLRVVAPLGAMLASIAGVTIVAQTVQVATHGALAHVPHAARYAGAVAACAGLFALLLVTWRLGRSVITAAARWADRRAEADKTKVPPRRRRLRGLSIAIVVLPVTFFAVFQSSLVATLRALWPLS